MNDAYEGKDHRTRALQQMRESVADAGDRYVEDATNQRISLEIVEPLLIEYRAWRRWSEDQIHNERF